MSSQPQVFSSLQGTEAIVCGLWKVVLGLAEMDIDDNFFDLGGTARLADMLRSRINQTFESQLSIAAIYQYPTVRAMAGWLHYSVSTGRERRDDSLLTGPQAIDPETAMGAEESKFQAGMAAASGGETAFGEAPKAVRRWSN